MFKPFILEHQNWNLIFVEGQKANTCCVVTMQENYAGHPIFWYPSFSLLFLI